MRKAAEIVFAVHWVDDAFDYLEFHQHENTSGDRIDIATADTRAVGRFYSPHGLNRMLSAIKGESRFRALRWADLGKPPWTAGVEAGLMRVILGGFVQRGDAGQKRAAIERLRVETDTFIADAVKRQL